MFQELRKHHCIFLALNHSPLEPRKGKKTKGGTFLGSTESAKNKSVEVKQAKRPYFAGLKDFIKKLDKARDGAPRLKREAQPVQFGWNPGSILRYFKNSPGPSIHRRKGLKFEDSRSRPTQRPGVYPNVRRQSKYETLLPQKEYLNDGYQDFEAQLKQYYSDELKATTTSRPRASRIKARQKTTRPAYQPDSLGIPGFYDVLARSKKAKGQRPRI